MFRRLIGLLALAVALAPCGAWAAEDWVLFHTDSGGQMYIDVNGVSREGDVASGWVRGERLRTDRTASGQRYNSAMYLMEYNCKSLLMRMSRAIALDGKGNHIEDTEVNLTWDSIDKKSLDIPLSNAFCLISGAETKPDIRSGTWRNMGREKGHQLSLLWSQIVESADNQILVITRDDFDEYQALEGLPFKHVLVGTAFDCRRRMAAEVRSEYYLDWVREVYVKPVPDKDIKFKPPAPGTLGYQNFDELCAAPHVPDRATAAVTEGLSTGTAWATNKGYLVTASHVIDGGKTIEVYQNNEKVGEAVVVGNDPANDVAVLKYIPAGGKKVRIIPLSDKAGALGKSVFTLGFPAPDVMGQAIKMSAGDISATSGIQDDARFLQVSIPIQEGNSGGPVIGFDGAAVGVVSAKLAKLSEERDAPKPENVNYAVKIAYVKPLLEELPDLADYLPLKVSGATPEDLIAQAREAVFMLVVRP